MSGNRQTNWIPPTTPDRPTTNIDANGQWKLASAGPSQGSISLVMAAAGQTCTVLVKDEAGNTLGDSMSVSGTTKVLLTNSGSPSAFFLHGDIYLQVSALSSGATLYAAVLS